MPGTRRRAPSLRVPPCIFSLPVLTKIKSREQQGEGNHSFVFFGEEKGLTRRRPPCLSSTGSAFPLHSKISKAPKVANNQQPGLGQSAASPQQRRRQDRFGA